MSQNRIQFQKGMSLPTFFERYGTEEQCVQALVQVRWGGGFTCSRCGGQRAWTWQRQAHAYRVCESCDHQCSVTAGTVMHHTKLPLRRWFLAMFLLSQAKNGISALELKRHLGVSYPTAWLVKHKLMLAMQEAEADRQLTGRVEMDDAYLGGERSGGKPGRGSENKVPFVVAVQTIGPNHKPHRVCLAQIPHRLAEVSSFCSHHLQRPLTVWSDGLACFAAAQAAGIHQPVVTGGGSASAKDPRFHGVNTYLGNLKSAIKGTYRSFKFAKYAPHYFAEFQFRFNRREDLETMLGSLVAAAIQRAPAPPRRSAGELEARC
jgi:hypothetical protein